MITHVNIKPINSKKPVNVVILPGSGEYVIKCSATDRKKIVAEVSGGQLIVSANAFAYLEEILIEIYSSDVEILTVSGNAVVECMGLAATGDIRYSGSIYSDLTLCGKEYKFTLAGDTRVSANITAELLAISAAGGNNIDMCGEADRANLVASGSNFIDAQTLITNICNIQGNGDTKVNIGCRDKLNVNVSGYANIHYKGDAVLNQHTSGYADIVKVY